jgi:hypothetical protein
LFSRKIKRQTSSALIIDHFFFTKTFIDHTWQT